MCDPIKLLNFNFYSIKYKIEKKKEQINLTDGKLNKKKNS